MSYRLAALVSIIGVISACAPTRATAPIDDVPIPRVAIQVEDFVIKNRPELNLEPPLPPYYLVWVCFENTANRKVEYFDLGYFMKGPRNLLSQTWSSGEPAALGVSQAVRITSDFLDIGDMSLSAVLQPTREESRRWVNVKITQLLRSDQSEDYEIDTGADEHPCAFAKPLEEEFRSIGVETTIH